MLEKLTYKLISQIGVREKYIRKDHFNSIKIWWARRPITAMRSLLIREVLRRKGKQDAFVDPNLFSTINPPKEVFKLFQNENNTRRLNVLDVFSGGGSIPFESARLGFNTFSSELNPVATLLQEAIFESVGIKDYDEKLRFTGHKVISRVEKRIEKYFLLDGIRPYVIFWSKVAKCKSCGSDLDLRRLEYLSKRKSKPIRITKDKGTLELEYSFDAEDGLQKEFVCSNCRQTNSFKDIRAFCKENRLRHSAFAYCYVSKGKKYKLINDEHKRVLNEYSKEIQTDLQRLSFLLPTDNVKLKGGVINPTLYDLKNPQDFFSERQLLVLLTLIEEITLEYPSLVNQYGKFDAKQIVLGLTSLVEFLVDWNSVSTMWISQNEQTGRSLAGPGVGMKWDFIEINPFSNVGSNLRSKMDRVADAFRAIRFDNPIKILKGSSTRLDIENDSIDIVLTDPPYYDSIDYTGLSEFFRPWFEILISKTYSSTIDLKNQDNFEAIVELTSKSSKGHNHYQSIMTSVFREVNRVLNPKGSVLMLYSHKTFEGWKVIADSFVGSKLFVSECIPIEMERIARPRAMSYEALNGVITFRLLKSKEGIRAIADDIAELKNMLSHGEILDSQIVIYLAALAVKQVSLTGVAFVDAYESVIKTYERIRLDSWINGRMDFVTKSYLLAKLNGSLKDLDNSYFEILTESNLIVDSRLKTLDEICLSSKIRDTVLETALLVYNDFRSNTRTKISLASDQKECLITFYSIIGGIELNTVSKRSSSIEAKVARLVLSKVA